MGSHRVVFVWENLGPTHFDRLRAAINDPELAVTAIEFFDTSLVYDWDSSGFEGLRRKTLYQQGRSARRPGLWLRLIKAILQERPQAVFLCHYSYPHVFIAAVILKLLGIPVFAMIDSKFDDMPRRLLLEGVKTIVLAPYDGALAGSRRCAEYLRFLGLRKRPVVEGYDCLDVARLKALGQQRESARQPHAARDFLVVARLIREKNLEFALRAFAQWRQSAVHPRQLRILGGGPLEQPLKTLAEELGIADDVDFCGPADPQQVAEAMQDGLALLFPSIQETFGFVVIEALAQGLPVLISTVPGAVDGLIDNGVNGWLVDPYRPAGLAAAMALLDRDEAVWRNASAAASASAERGDVRHFVAGVKALIAGD
ncbi:MAG: glycosyltransferase [Novosphingobium sp.]